MSTSVSVMNGNGVVNGTVLLVLLLIGLFLLPMLLQRIALREQCFVAPCGVNRSGTGHPSRGTSCPVPTGPLVSCPVLLCRVTPILCASLRVCFFSSGLPLQNVSKTTSKSRDHSRHALLSHVHPSPRSPPLLDSQGRQYACPASCAFTANFTALSSSS